MQATVTITTMNYIVVPAYTAMFIQELTST